MELSKQVCTLEQAKRLKELGVDQESRFHWWWFLKDLGNDGPQIVYQGKLKATGTLSNVQECSAYTVAELGEMIKMVGLYSCVNTFLGGWAIHHVNGYKEFEFPQPGNINSYDTEAEARAAILIHLIESSLITIEETNKRLQQ